MYVSIVHIPRHSIFVRSEFIVAEKTLIITEIIITLLNCYFARMLQSYKLLPSSGYLFCCIFVLLLISIHTFQTILTRCFSVQIFAFSSTNIYDVWTVESKRRCLWCRNSKTTSGGAPKWKWIIARAWTNWPRAYNCGIKNKNKSEYA